MAELTSAERREEILMMRDEDPKNSWTWWPLLPVKRRGGATGRDLGVTVSTKPWVWLTNLHDVPSGRVGEVLEPFERLEYADYDAVLDDGWTVD